MFSMALTNRRERFVYEKPNLIQYGMADRSPKNFSPPNQFAQFAVRPESVRPPVFFLLGPFPII